MTTTEHVERQVAVTAIVTVKEPPLLLAMERVIGRVEVEDDLLRWPLVRLQEQIDEQVGERRRVVTDLMIAVIGPQRGVFQPVERALAGERRAVRPLRLEPVGEQREHRVVAQLVVVVHVLIAQGDADDPLSHQGRQHVHHLVLLAVVLKARGDPLDQADRAIGVAQQQPAPVGGHGAAVERRHHPPRSEAFKLELFQGTLCLHRTPPTNPGKCLSQQHYPRFSGPMHLLP
jgi:hypothetical protein